MRSWWGFPRRWSRSGTDGSMPSEIPLIRPTLPEPDRTRRGLRGHRRRQLVHELRSEGGKSSPALGDYLGPDLHVATFANGTLALIAALHATAGPVTGQLPFDALVHFYLGGPGCSVPVPAAVHRHRPRYLAAQPYSARAIPTLPPPVRRILLADMFGVGNPSIAARGGSRRRVGRIDRARFGGGIRREYADGAFGGRGACEIFSFHATKLFASGRAAHSCLDTRGWRASRTFQNFGFGEPGSVHSARDERKAARD